jgi:DNA gyrase subunit A
MRVVIELKRDATAEVVLNQLYRFTPLQISFGVNMLALDGGRPQLMGLKDAAADLHRLPRGGGRPAGTDVRAGKARDRAHLLVGLAIAVANIDEVIALIRAAPDAAEARAALMARDWPADDIGAADRADRRPAQRVWRRRDRAGCPRSRRAASSTCACSA